MIAAPTSNRLPAARRFDVPANTLVVADTFGFHARTAAMQASARVEIWAYGRRNPFLPWIGLDPLSMPGLAERRVELHWRLRAWLEHRRGRLRHDIKDRSAFEY